MIVLFELVGFPFEMNGLGCPCRLAMFCFLVLNVCCLPVFCYRFVWLMYVGMGRRLHGEMIVLHCCWLLCLLVIVFGSYCLWLYCFRYCLWLISFSDCYVFVCFRLLFGCLCLFKCFNATQ